MNHQANFILVSGIKGTGKTTLSGLLVNDHLKNVKKKNEYLVVIISGSLDDNYKITKGVDIVKFRLSFENVAALVQLREKRQLLSPHEIDIIDEELSLNNKLMKRKILLVMDDLLNFQQYKSKTFDLLSSIAMNCRHLFDLVVLNTQHIQELPTGITSQSDLIYMKKMLSTNIRVVLRRFLDPKTTNIEDYVSSMVDAFLEDKFATFLLETSNSSLIQVLAKPQKKRVK